MMVFIVNTRNFTLKNHVYEYEGIDTFTVTQFNSIEEAKKNCVVDGEIPVVPAREVSVIETENEHLRQRIYDLMQENESLRNQTETATLYYAIVYEPYPELRWFKTKEKAEEFVKNYDDEGRCEFYDYYNVSVLADSKLFNKTKD